MKRLCSLISLLLLVSLPIAAQSADELRQKIEEMKRRNEQVKQDIAKFHECFYELSLPKPTDVSVTLSSGKTVSFLAQSDYERSAFVSADKLLQDIRQWKDSPYLWQMQHRKDNTAVMDTQGLAKWEIDNFEIISESYFKGTNSTFHIAAHGLVDAHRQAADHIRIGGQDLDAAETAELIIKTMGSSKDKSFQYILDAAEQDFVVVVHCCHSADGEDNFSSQLSRELAKYLNKVAVVGAPDIVYCAMDGDRYVEYSTPVHDIRRDNPRKQAWKVYRNGEDTGQGNLDYRQTVIGIQQEQ